MFYSEFVNVGIFSIISFIISFILFMLSYILDLFFFSTKQDFEKLLAYECGFQPFSDARDTFDVRFYLVAILFIIFDLEIAFIFPWILTSVKYNLFDTIVIYVFIFILTVGYYFEWFKGGLNW